MYTLGPANYGTISYCHAGVVLFKPVYCRCDPLALITSPFREIKLNLALTVLCPLFIVSFKRGSTEYIHTHMPMMSTE